MAAKPPKVPPTHVVTTDSLVTRKSFSGCMADTTLPSSAWMRVSVWSGLVWTGSGGAASSPGTGAHCKKIHYKCIQMLKTLRTLDLC